MVQHAPETLEAYTSPRPDILSLIDRKPLRALDVGCATGTLGAALKMRGVHVTGIELDSEFAAIAETRINRCINDDALRAVDTLLREGQKFDLLIFADVLEHLPEPDMVLAEARELLSPEGQCIVSLPNVRFYTTFTSLLFRARWPRNAFGIHDRTHLRWFTKRDAEEMFANAGFAARQNLTHYRLLDRPHRGTRLLGRIAVPPLRPFIAYQYVWDLRPVPTSGQKA